MFSISIYSEHILCKQNVVADLLSTYQFDQKSWELLKTYVSEAVWIPTPINLTCLIYTADLSAGMAQWLPGLTCICCIHFDLLHKELTPGCSKISLPSLWSLGCPSAG